MQPDRQGNFRNQRYTWPGRGTVQAEPLEFEVVYGDDTLFAYQGQFLFTKPRAMLIARGVGGKLWRMEHTPYNSPQSFGPIAGTLFRNAQCSYVIDYRAVALARFCGAPTVARADYGYCAAHKNQLLEASRFRACARRHMPVLACMVPRAPRGAVNCTACCSGRAHCMFGISGSRRYTW